MTDDALVHEIANIPIAESLPHESLSQSLGKTKEIVTTVQSLQKQYEEAARKANKEIRSHEQTKDKIKAAEGEHAKARELMEKEVKEHALTKEELNRAEREHMKTRDFLQAQRHEVSSMLLQMEALKVEMEAQRKAFVVNVNWASRCTDLKVKFDGSVADYDKLYEQHFQTKNALVAAQKAQEEYRNNSVSTLQILDDAKRELVRQREELDGKTGVGEDVQKKLQEWQKFKDIMAADSIAAGRGKSKALGVLERQLAEGDTGLVMNFFFAWHAFVRDEIKQRRHKDQAMKSAMKTIANEGIGLLSQCFGPWKKETSDEKKKAIDAANRKLDEAMKNGGERAEMARKRALAQLEKQFIGEDKALIQSVFQSWALDKVTRKKKEDNMRKGGRMIANSAKAVVAEVFMLWNEMTEKTRIKKKQTAAGHTKAARMIAGSDRALTANIFQEWAVWVKKLAGERKMKAAGNEKAVRMMANSSQMLMNICFDSWAKVQQEKRKKDAGGKKAARMISGSNEAITITVFQGWKGSFLSTKKEEGNTAKAVRMIAASGEALQASSFQGWAQHVRTSREKNKKLRAVEKTLGASADGVKLLVITAWFNTTAVEGRKKRSKQRSMGCAMKSINGNQDLLMTQITMGWARIVAQERVVKQQEKVSDAQKALDNAMEAATKAVEEDVGKCQLEIDRLNGELEVVQKLWKEAMDKAAGLESQIEEAGGLIEDRKGQLKSLVDEVEVSRQKARDIGDELAKVGIFLQGSTPRKPSRPRSGQKSGKDEQGLPKIGKEPGRPMSGTKRSGSGGAAAPPAKAWGNDDSSYQS